MTRIDHLAVLALTAAFTAGLAILVLLKRRTRSHLLFGIYSLSLTWWSFFQLLMIREMRPDISLRWSRIEQMGVVFIPTLFVHFAATFLNRRVPRQWFYGTYGISTILAAIAPSTSLVISYTPWRFGRMYFGTGGPLYPFVILYFVAGTFCGLKMLIEAYTRALPSTKNQLRYLLWG